MAIQINNSTIIDDSRNIVNAGVVTATSFVGPLTGTATTATYAVQLQTPRTISLTGDVIGEVSFDGTSNVSIAATIQPDSVTLGGDTTGNYVASIANGSYITGADGGNEGSALTIGVAATSANTANQVVARDASGNFSAGTITANLTGTASSTTNIPNLTGDVTSVNTTTTLANVNNDVGTYGSSTSIPSITVNAKGLVTGVTTNAITVGDGTLTLNVAGVGLTGSQTFTANQSGNATFTVTSNATSDNTASAIVARDASGGFSAGIVTVTSIGVSTSVSITSLEYVTSSTGITTIDSFDKTLYRSAKYQIQMTNDTDYQAVELLILHDNDNSNIYQYNGLSIVSNCGILTSQINANNVELLLTPSSSENTNIVMMRTLIRNTGNATIRALGLVGDLGSGSGTIDLQSQSGTLDLNI